MKTAAVVIWTPGDPDPGPCLDSLAPQVDELVLTLNPGGSPSTRAAKVIANKRTLGFGANINRGVAATSAPYVVASNSDIEVDDPFASSANCLSRAMASSARSAGINRWS